MELDRIRKQLEADKLSLGSAIDEYREQIHIEVTKYNVLNASIDKLRSDLEKKIADKDEELENLRSNQRKQLEQAQSQLEEVEVRYKTELSRTKSKLQNELEETRVRYETMKKAKGDIENHLRKIQNGIKDAQDRLLEEQTAHSATKDLLSASEKRFSMIFTSFLTLVIAVFFLQVLFMQKSMNYVVYSIAYVLS